MPSRKLARKDISDAYYHLFLRGVNKQPIFIGQEDYEYFYKLLARYLSKTDERMRSGEIYPDYSKDVKLLAFCLMENHFHLLVYQITAGGITKFMRSLLTSYSMYFNLKYKRTGPLFESSYKSSLIDNREYLEHISRYIHINPRSWRQYRHSSLKYYLNEQPPGWLDINKILGLFINSYDYLTFISDYEDRKIMLKRIRHTLADH
jgi:putative transposase